jgi:hypothetical protein
MGLLSPSFDSASKLWRNHAAKKSSKNMFQIGPSQPPKPLTRDILAEVAQALEMKLIYPAFRLARETREFTIVLFQHDGFSLHFVRREEMWLTRIANAIQEEITQHRVETRLEW